VNFFDRIFVSTARGAFRLLDALLNQALSWHWACFLCVSALGLTFCFVGRRLRKFNHPDQPLLSPAIRAFLGTALLSTGAVLSGSLVLLILTAALLLVAGAVSQAAVQGTDQWSMIEYYFFRIWPWVKPPALGTLSGALIGVGLSVVLTMRTIPRLERGQGLRDVRHMHRLFAGMKDFSPLQYIDLHKGIFIGLEDGLYPVHVPLRPFQETMTQVIGASGSGKGIALGLMAYQFVLARECCIVFDPKGDRRLPLQLALAAKKARVAFHQLDLNPEMPPQFNLLSGALAHEIEEIFIGGLGLQPTAGDADYYRGIDQDAAEKIAQRVATTGAPSLVSALAIAIRDEGICKADNFVRRLRQVCQLRAIQTNHNFDLAGIVERGDVLYVRGSTDNHRVKTLQTMLLIRLLQIIKSGGSGRKVAMVLDEFKHVLCSVSLDALGTVRELGCHVILAHQSMGDLGAIPGLRREDVEPRVVDNTTLKLVYRLNDAKASADFAARSGKQRTHAEGIRGLDDNNKDQRSWNEVQQFRMSEDLFTHLHRPSDGKGVVAAGVLFGYKAARLIAVSPIHVTGTVPPVRPAPSGTIEMPSEAEALI
jgi:hypothetical protein